MREFEEMQTISVMNVKGGVGKTITAVNVAQILAGEHEARVLLIDADPQGDASYLLAPEEEDFAGTYGVLTTGGAYEDYILPTRYRYLDIMPGNSDLFYVSMELADKAVKSMGDLLDNLREDSAYDYVIIDCPPSFSAPSIAAICNSNQVIIPVKLDALGIRGCNFLVDQIEAMRDYNPDLAIPSVLVTMYHNVEVCVKSLELLHEYGFNVFDTIIRRTDKVPESTYYAQALGEYSRQSAAGRDYRRFVDELLQGGAEGGVTDGV